MLYFLLNVESKILLQMLIYKNIVFSFENSFEK